MCARQLIDVRLPAAVAAAVIALLLLSSFTTPGLAQAKATSSAAVHSALSAKALNGRCTTPDAICIPDHMFTLIFTVSGVGGCAWTARIDWGDNDIETVNFGDGGISKTHEYKLPGVYHLSVTGSGTPTRPNLTCTFFPATLLLEVPVDHYVIDMQAWIPFPAVVDPLMPGPTRFLDSLVFPGPLDPNCYIPRGLDLLTTTVSSTYRGDGHVAYGGGSYRLRTEVSFDFNPSTNEITKFTQNSVPAFGASHRDKVYTSRGNVLATCTQAADTTNTQTARMSGATGFTMGYKGGNPLSNPQFATPSAVGTVTGAVAKDGNLTLNYTTTRFPSHGIQVSIDDEIVLTTIENDVSCIGSPLGVRAAAVIALDLNLKASGSVVATPGGNSSTVTPSPRC